MSMRKIAVVGSFAAGAALALAPIASADDLSSIVDSEISLSNSIFDSEAALAEIDRSVWRLVLSASVILLWVAVAAWVYIHHFLSGAPSKPSCTQPRGGR